MKRDKLISKSFGIALVFVMLASTFGVLAWASGSDVVGAGYADVSVEQAKAMIDSDPDVIVPDVGTENEYAAGHIADAESNSSLSPEINAILDADKSAFLFFYSDWCHFCHEQMPIIEELEVEYAEEIGVIHVNSEDNPQAITGFGVAAFPTMFLISDRSADGEYRYQDFAGFTDKETLRQSFDRAITNGNIFDGSGVDSDGIGEEATAITTTDISQDLCIQALAAEACPDHCECLTDEEAEEQELTLCDDELTECEFYYPPLGIYVMGHCYRTEEDDEIPDDGIDDEEDNCPQHYNPQQEDTDRDGIGDVCDFLTLFPVHPLPGDTTRIEVRAPDESEVSMIVILLDGRPVEKCDLSSLSALQDDPGGSIPDCLTEFIFSEGLEINVVAIDMYDRIFVYDSFGESAQPEVLADCHGDDDGDGVENYLDNCRYVQNDQQNSDQDEVGDACDLCDPARTKGITVTGSWDFYDSDGCGYDDTDHVGLGYGRNYYTQGELRTQTKDAQINCWEHPIHGTICENTVTTLATDSCVDNATLREYYFVSMNGTYADEQYPCPYGGCQVGAGACLCYDTDGEKNYDVKGSVGGYEDYCYANGRSVREYWTEVSGDQCFLKWYPHTCDGSCQDGACVAPNCTDGIQNQGETNIDCGGPCNISCDQVRISGRILYQEADADPRRNIPQGFKPARSVVVKLYSDHSHPADSIAQTTTNRDGYFSFVITRHIDALYHVRIKAENRAARVHKDFDGACNEYVFWESKNDVQIRATGNVDFGDLYIGIDTDLDFEAWSYEKPPCAGIETDYDRYQAGGSVYFNIAESILLAREYVEDHRGSGFDDSIDQVRVQYPDSDWNNCSYPWGVITLTRPDFSAKKKDWGFVDAMILHEYGHYIQLELATWDNPDYNGDEHDMCVACGDYETAFSEGFANYLSYVVYHHHQDPANFISPVEYRPGSDLEDGCIDAGGKLEGNVMSALWDLVDDPSFPDSSNESWDTLSGLEDFILGVLDGEMDNWWNDAPGICEMRDCYGTRGTETLSDLDSIFAALGIDCSDVSRGSCNGRE